MEEIQIMKKILSAVLATAMLSTVAMAAGTGIVTDAFNGDVLFSAIDATAEAAYVNAGTSIHLVPGDFKNEKSKAPLIEQVAKGYEFNDEFFSVTTKKFTKDASLVESVKFGSIGDGDETLVIKLKPSTTLTGVKKTNLTIDEIKIRAKKTSDQDDGATPAVALFKYRDSFIADLNESIKVVTSTDTYYSAAKGEVAGIDSIKPSAKLHIANFKDDTDTVVTPYAEGSLNAPTAFMYGRVYHEDKFLLNVTEKYNIDVLKAYDTIDSDANLDFVNVTMDGLATAWTIDIIADEDSYLYEVDEDGVLTESNLEWSDEQYAFTGRIRGNKNFVVSDVELDLDAVEEDKETEEDKEDDTKNPNTGR